MPSYAIFVDIHQINVVLILQEGAVYVAMDSIIAPLCNNVCCRLSLESRSGDLRHIQRDFGSEIVPSSVAYNFEGNS